MTPIEQLQAQSELDSIANGQKRSEDREAKFIRSNQQSHSQAVRQLYNECVNSLLPAIERFLAPTEKGKRGPKHIVKAPLRQLNAKRAAIIISEVVINHLSPVMDASDMTRKIGDEVIDQLLYIAIQEKKPDAIKPLQKAVTSGHIWKLRESAQWIAKSIPGVAELKTLRKEHREKIGGECIELFIQNTDVFVQSKVIKRRVNGKWTSHQPLVVKPEVLARVEENRDFLKDRDPIHLPMLIKPAPWANAGDGGYMGFAVEKRMSLIKDCSVDSLGYLPDNTGMPTVYHAVNALQDTTWRVNRRVYEVVRQIERAGGNVELGVIRGESIFDKRTKTALDVSKPAVLGADDDHEAAEQNPEVLGEWIDTKNGERAREEDRKTLRITYENTMEVAEKFLDASKCYFPYNLDFRGRAYPIPVYLSPQGRDLEKGMLMFAEGKPLGSDEAWRWFILHGVNCLEVDPFTAPYVSTKLSGCRPAKRKLNKMPVLFRYEWVMDHRSLICAAAADPILNDWWMIADAPLQFLAWCFEFAEWSRMDDEEDRGLEFVSYLPIAIDGSCNGLQHFACLLRDEQLAEHVNLVTSSTSSDRALPVPSEPTMPTPPEDDESGMDGEFPEDVYEEIVYQVKERLETIESLAMDDDARRAKDLLKWGFVNRKLLKKNVVAFTYGSNEQGFKGKYMEFVADEKNKATVHNLQEIAGGWKLYPHFDLLAKVLWDILSDPNGIARSAVVAMNWLKELVEIANVEDKPIYWTVPSGFVVKMDNRVVLTKHVKFPLFKKPFKQTVDQDADVIDKDAQVIGISANFIHSMDASHLMSTLSELSSVAGVRHFATAHDSFATHAADTGHLCQTIKEQLVLLYRDQSDIMGNLERDVLAGVTSPVVLPIRPATGTLDLAHQLPRQGTFAFI